MRLHGWWKPTTAAAIVQSETGYTLIDFNGETLLNSQPLPDGSQELKDGDVLEVSGLVIQFCLATQGIQAARTAKSA